MISAATLVIPNSETELTETELIASNRSWQGRLSLEFERRAPKTILSRSQVQAPLKIQRSFYPEGDSICHSVMLHTAGGIVGGDRLLVDIQLGAATEVLLTTAAATKVYRSNGQAAEQTTQIRVAAAAHLEWLPQETILFDGAIYQQQLKVELAADASWLSWDITRLGRSARGEKFASGQWRSRTEIWQNDRLIWIDPQVVEGGSAMITHPHGLASYPVIGSFVMVGRSISNELLENLRSIDPFHSVLNQPSEQLVADVATGNNQTGNNQTGNNQTGITRLSAGLLCRYRGHSTAEAKRWFITLWQQLRQAQNQEICIPRVWQL